MVNIIYSFQVLSLQLSGWPQKRTGLNIYWQGPVAVISRFGRQERAAREVGLGAVVQAVAKTARATAKMIFMAWTFL